VVFKLGLAIKTKGLCSKKEKEGGARKKKGGEFKRRV